MIDHDKIRAAFEAAYPAAIRARHDDTYGGAFGSMFIVWQQAVESCAPAAVEQVDALTDERAAFEAYRPTMHLTRNQHGLYENLYVDAAWRAWQARAILAAARPVAPVQPDLRQTQAEIEKLHRELAGERLRADQGWARYESANADRNALRAERVAAPVQPVLQARLADEAAWTDIDQTVYDHALANGMEVRKLFEAAPVQTAPEKSKSFEFLFSGEKITFDSSGEWTLPATYRRLVPLAQELARRLHSSAVTAKPMYDENARYAIEETIGRGKDGTHKPPSDSHWLMPFWEIGRQLAAAKAHVEPAGFVMAPDVATDAMCQAGQDSGKNSSFSYSKCYAAMLAAAPAPVSAK